MDNRGSASAIAKRRASFLANPANKNPGEKVKAGLIAKYGSLEAAYAFQAKRRQATMQKRYGVAHAFSNPELLAKQRATMRERYGVDCPQQNNEIKRATVRTNRRIYGTDNPAQSDLIKARIVDGNMRSMGVPYAMQNAESFSKVQRSGTHLKTLTLGGREFTCQGYEPFALKVLIEKMGVKASRVFTNPMDMPEVWFEDVNGARRRYYPDIKVSGKSADRFIEVKSTFTLGIGNETRLAANKRKWRAMSRAGHDVKLWVIFPKKKTIVRFDSPHLLSETDIMRRIQPMYSPYF